MDHPPFEAADPATWVRTSYTADPIDSMEPLPDPSTENYRESSRRFLHVMLCVDTFLSTARDARIASIQIAVAMGLPSVQGRTVTATAAELGITKQALSRGVARFLRMSGLPEAWGLKSAAARQVYRRTNGVRHEG